VIVDCAVYREGRRQQVEAMSLTEAAAQRGPDTFVWLGTLDPSPAELADIRDTFGLHELAVEDAREFHLRPKVEQFDDDVQLVILRTARYDDAREEIDFGEISAFLGAGFVITVRQGWPASCAAPGSVSNAGPSCWRRGAPPCCGRFWIRWSTATRR